MGERSREGNDLWLEMKESGVLKNTMLVFGQMNEPPGARMRVALTGLTMAEYFREQGGQDVLLFIDNIFRFVQAGSEVSALLGRMPSQVGYQPTLETEMGQLQERITSTRQGSVTSIQAIYVPADDLTDPAPASVFRAPERHDHPLALDFREGDLPGGGPARLDVDDPQGGRARRRALPGRDPGQGDPAALPGAPGHHCDPGGTRFSCSGWSYRVSRPDVMVFLVVRCPAMRRIANNPSIEPNGSFVSLAEYACDRCRQQVIAGNRLLLLEEFHPYPKASVRVDIATSAYSGSSAPASASPQSMMRWWSAGGTPSRWQSATAGVTAE